MRLKLNTKILLGFGTALALLLLTSLAAYRSIQQLSIQTRWVEHTYQVLQATADLRTNLRDAQGSLRSYLLTTDTTFLATHRAGLRGVDTNLDGLLILTRDNLEQQNRLDTLRRVIATEKQLLVRWRQRAPTPEAARALVLADRSVLVSIRDLVQRLGNTEAALLNERRQNQDFYENTTPLIILATAVLAVLLVSWLIIKISRELAANQRLQAELARVNADTAQRIALMEQLADRVVQGDYTVQIENGQPQDSLGNLAASLNRMTHTLDANFTALQNRNQELDQFAYVASHDLKAPLRGVATVVKWIEDELPHELSAQMRQYLGMVKERLHRLEDLINGLLAYARAGRAVPQLETVNVAQLVRDVAELVVPAAFQVKLDDALPTFQTDRLSLQQVFTNLLGNAAKYHHQATGTIQVSCRGAENFYEFRVQDDGPGIAPEYHQKIFLMFQTLRDRHTAESTGIGLSIVKKIVEEKNGTIRVESAAGQGATFVFTWPKF